MKLCESIGIEDIGLYEMTLAMLGKSHTEEGAMEFATKVMVYLRETCDRWKKETGLGFGLYGTPEIQRAA